MELFPTGILESFQLTGKDNTETSTKSKQHDFLWNYVNASDRALYRSLGVFSDGADVFHQCVMSCPDEIRCY